MRYAVVSDVHGNLEALQAALDLLAPADALLCLGDIVGYGPNPNECVQLMRERATATVLGNHDVAAIDGFGLSSFNPTAREALQWTQAVLSTGNLSWLNSLGYEFRLPECLLVHGAPVTYFEYIVDKAGAARAFSATDAPLIFIGHTHIAEHYALRADGSIEHKHWQHGGTFSLEAGSRYIINVGSVGQPRDLNPQASFAFFEPASASVTMTRVAYPIPLVQAKIASANLPAMLARRLGLGR